MAAGLATTIPANVSTIRAMVRMPPESLEQWVHRVVVGLDLCPFAASPLNAGRVRFARCESREVRPCVEAAAAELSRLVERPPEELSTTLLSFPGWTEFERFLALAETVMDLAADAGLDGLVQVVVFHPDWVAEGEDADDPATATNRSPEPALHFLREEEVERAVRGYPDIEALLDRNAQRLRALGWEGLSPAGPSSE